MARSSGPTIGLDIGSNMIKVVEAVPGRNGVTIRAVGMAPTPPGAMENNVIVDAQLLGQAVKKLLRETGISTKSSVSSVSGQSALVVRVIEVPKMSEAELAETMKWEVERHVPFAANEVIMDFQPIERTDTPPDAQNMEVLLAVAQQDMVDRHVEMLFAAGFSPKAIDVEPLAAARSLIEMGPDPLGRKTVAIVNIGAANTDIGIFHDGILSFPRTLPLAGDNINRAIAGQMGLAEEQAEEMKRNYGEVILGQIAQPQAPIASDAFMDFSLAPALEETPAAPAPPERMPFDFSVGEDTAPVAPAEGAPDSGAGFDLGGAPEIGGVAPAPQASGLPAPVESHDPTKVQVFTAMAPVLSELLAELRRSIEYYRGRATDGQIDEILLCGGSAKIKNLDQFFTSELGIPTRVANPFQYATLAARNFSQEYLQDVAPLFVVAVGLAARDMVAVPAMAGAGSGRRGRKKK